MNAQHFYQRRVAITAGESCLATENISRHAVMKLLILLGLVLPAMSRQINQFVVGGSTSDISQHPHQLSLRVRGSHSCGASLISSTRAVCAAHCGGQTLSSYSVLGGSTRRTVENCANCVVFDLTGFERHPQYSSAGALGFPNDISVLQFASQSQNGDFSQISLATASDGDFAGDSCEISGWGRTNIGTAGTLPLDLQDARMTVMTNSACESAWSAAQINSGHICLTAASASACNGDSGGPLVCNNKLAGATSWGVDTCDPSYASVYTRVSYFYDWIVAQ